MDTSPPRIWRARIWTKGGPFEGTGFVFKQPIGEAILAASALVDMEERYEITRFQLGPVPSKQLSSFSRVERDSLQRFWPALYDVAKQIGVEWSW